MSEKLDACSKRNMTPDQLAQFTDYLRRQPEVALAYLYGSHTTGRARPDSDVDIGVLFREAVPRVDRARSCLRFAGELGRLTDQDVDVRELNDASLEFKMQVIRPRRCLVAAHEIERVRFEARVISEYLDFKPVLDLYYGYMTDRLSRGDVLYGTRFRDRLRALGYAPRAEKDA